MRASPRVIAAAAGLLAWGLLLHGTAARYGRPLDEAHRHMRRYWEELTVATSNYLNAGRTAPATPLASNEGGDLYTAYKRYMPKASEGFVPWHFWRTIEIKPFLKRGPMTLRPYDDPGRELLMRAGFHVLGGVAPFLGLWLGVLFIAPVLAWLAWELARAGRRLEALLLPALLGCSAFLVDTLGLPYSAVGFYVIAAVMLVAFATHVFLGPTVTRRGLFARALAAGVLFALCAYVRSGTLLLGGGFLLAAGWGLERALRAEGAPRGLRPRALPALLLAVALLGPYALVRPPRHHGIWGDLWQGLGDFDRTRGHSWSDGALRQMLRREGLKIGRNVGVDFESAHSEALLKRIFLDDVRAAPGWYALILVKRVGATLTQWKLLPWPPTSGLSYAPQTSENEGLTDAYYDMVAPIDVFGVGLRRVEVPLPLLWLPPLGLLAAWIAARRRGAAEAASERASELGVLACLAAATLPIPLIFSTSTAFETQTFGLVYLTGGAFALGALVRARRSAA